MNKDACDAKILISKMSRKNWALFSSSRVAGYENSFLGLQSKLSVMAKKKLRDQPEAVDVLSFGKIQLRQLRANFWDLILF